MAKHVVKCRYCGKQFDTNEEEFVCPSRNFYYHVQCYAEFKQPGSKKEVKWDDLIYDFIAHDLKKSYDYFLCEAQRKKLLKAGCTDKGIYFALRYFYLIRNGDWEKGNGGIGIVEYIYEESAAYWAKVEQQRAGLLQAIELKAAQDAAERRTVQRKTKKTQQKEDFDEL